MAADPEALDRRLVDVFLESHKRAPRESVSDAGLIPPAPLAGHSALRAELAGVSASDAVFGD